MKTLKQAFHHIPRSHFLPEMVKWSARENRPLSIGYNQTNSQPSTVYTMLNWLGVKGADTILDVGSGSGWTTALLAYLTGDKGWVHATEIVPELLAFGRKNCEQLGIKNVSFHQAKKALGWAASAPYDRILVSASARTLPAELVAQLKPDGKMVIPVRDEILEVTIDNDGDVSTIHHPGFLFVPLL